MKPATTFPYVIMVGYNEKETSQDFPTKEIALEVFTAYQRDAKALTIYLYHEGLILKSFIRKV